jgi:hypothetical protein
VRGEQCLRQGVLSLHGAALIREEQQVLRARLALAHEPETLVVRQIPLQVIGDGLASLRSTSPGPLPPCRSAGPTDRSPDREGAKALSGTA